MVMPANRIHIVKRLCCPGKHWIPGLSQSTGITGAGISSLPFASSIGGLIYEIWNILRWLMSVNNLYCEIPFVFKISLSYQPSIWSGNVPLGRADRLNTNTTNMFRCQNGVIHIIHIVLNRQLNQSAMKFKDKSNLPLDFSCLNCCVW